MPESIGPVIKITGEAEFKKAIANINNEFKLLGSEMKLAVSQFEKNDKSAAALTVQNKVLGKEIDSQKGKISTLTTQYDKQNAALVTLKTKLDATKAAFAADSDEVAKAQKEYDNQNQTVRNLQGELDKATAGLNNMDRELKSNSESIDAQNSNWTKLGKSLDNIGTKMKTVGEGLSSAGKKMTVGLTAPILGAVAGLGAIVMKSSETADELQKLSDVTGLSAERLQELKYAGSALGVDLETITGAQAKLTKAMYASKDGTGEQAEAFKGLGISVMDGNGNLRDAKVVMGEAFDALNKMGNETERDALAQKMFGKSAMELNPLIKAGGEELARLTDEARNNGAVMSNESVAGLDKFGDSLDAMKLSISGAVGEATSKLMPIFEKLLPIIQDKIVPAIGNFAQKIADLIIKFTTLDPGTQKLILGAGAFLLAIGPIVTVVGAIVTAVGGIAGVFGTASIAIGAGGVAAGVATPAVAGLGASFGAALLPLLPFILGIGAVIAAGVLLYKHFSADAIPAVQLYGKETSDATKKAVNAYLDLDTKATDALNNLNWSGQKVTKETADALAKNFDDMGTQIKAGMDKHFGESLKTMQDFFGKSSALTTTEEAAALAAMTKDNENKKAGIEEREKAIKLILDTASTEKRALTQDEQIKINDIQANMKTNAVNALSETELESLAILERMKAQAGDITARQAAEVAKNSIEQKNKAVENANAQYTETIKAIIKQRDETGTISNDQANRLIKDAVKQKNESVAAATEMNNKVVEQAKLQSGAHIKEVDWETGQIKSKWQVMVDTNKTQNEEIKKNVGAKWAEIKTQFSSDMNSIGTTFSSKWSSIKTQFGKDMDNIKNIASGAIAAIKGFFTNLHLPSIKIPHIDLPHFSISGSFSLVPPKIPSIGVSWYDKGGVFNGPSIIGVGEKRPEFVGALDDLKDIFREVMGEKKGTPQIIFQGSYSFADKTDIDYFMNKAAVLVKRRT